MFSPGTKAPLSQAGLLLGARRNRLARVQSKQQLVPSSMGSEIVEDGGGLCQLGWRVFSSLAAFRALGMVIPPLGRQAERHGGGGSISGTSQPAAGSQVPSAPQQPGLHSRGKQGMVPCVEPLIGNHGTQGQRQKLFGQNTAPGG